MSILDLYNAYSIPYSTEDHKHCRPGWANTECPFCTGNPGLHLGCQIDHAHFYCWRCGWKPTIKAIAKIIGISEPQAKTLAKEYGIYSKRTTAPQYIDKRKVRLKGHKFPSGVSELKKQHIAYLTKRKFDPDEIINLWGLLGTGPVSLLDGINYKHRIIAPIYWKGKQVSFQARDITERSKLKYLACPKQREIIEHQQILYGLEKHWTDVGLIVEGITDVWRLGPSSIATFGIDFTKAQFRWMWRRFRRVIVIYDSEPQAKKQANKLVSELRFYGVSAHREDVDGDPGGMRQDDADHLVRQVLKIIK